MGPEDCSFFRGKVQLFCYILYFSAQFYRYIKFWSENYFLMCTVFFNCVDLYYNLLGIIGGSNVLNILLMVIGFCVDFKEKKVKEVVSEKNSI